MRMNFLCTAARMLITAFFFTLTAKVIAATLPVAQSLTVTVPFNTPTLITLVGSDPNPNGSFLIFTIVSAPTHGSFSYDTNSGYYIPNDGYQGTDTFTYTAGDTNGTSQVATVTITVTGPQSAATTTTLSAAPNPANQGQLVTFTATVMAASVNGSVSTKAAAARPQAAAAPTGTVHFSEGGAALADVALGGGAVYSTESLSVGSHTITATYSGDATYAGSTANVNVSVTAAPPPAESVRPAPALLTGALIAFATLLVAGAAIAKWQPNSDKP